MLSACAAHACAVRRPLEPGINMRSRCQPLHSWLVITLATFSVACTGTPAPSPMHGSPGQSAAADSISLVSRAVAAYWQDAGNARRWPLLVQQYRHTARATLIYLAPDNDAMSQETPRRAVVDGGWEFCIIGDRTPIRTGGSVIRIVRPRECDI